MARGVFVTRTTIISAVRDAMKEYCYSSGYEYAASFDALLERESPGVLLYAWLEGETSDASDSIFVQEWNLRVNIAASIKTEKGTIEDTSEEVMRNMKIILSQQGVRPAEALPMIIDNAHAIVLVQGNIVYVDESI